MNVVYDSEKLRKIAVALGAAKSKLEKVSQLEAAIASKVPAVVDTMIRQGLLSPHLKEAKIKAMSNVSELLDTLEKTANLVTSTKLGTSDVGNTQRAEPTADQVFVSRLMGR
jgi:uncharacterized protein (DUF2342 family)